MDSSVAACILKKDGHNVVGISMKLGNGPSGMLRSCCSLEDVNDARVVAERLGIPFYVMNFKDEFERKVLEYFTESYGSGETPNPCIYCNSEIKFDALLKKAGVLGAGKLATGHYARIEHVPSRGGYILKKGADSGKDQSYFLFNLNQEKLKNILFPLGYLTKSETKEMARAEGLPVHEKEESQDVCFLGDDGYFGVVGERAERGTEKGKIVDTSGRVLGEHRGYAGYTVGQRRGLGVSAPEPLYVLEIRPRTNEVVVGPDDGLFRRRMRVRSMNWILEERTGPFEGTVKIRYAHKGAGAVVKPLKNGEGIIEFHEPQRAITPGQAAVIYIGDEVTGGGWISGTEGEE